MINQNPPKLPLNKMPSHKLASLLVQKSLKAASNSDGDSKQTLSQLLKVLKNRKNFGFESFSNSFEASLKRQSRQIFNLLKVIQNLSIKMRDFFNPEGQIRSVAYGLKKYLVNFFKDEAIPQKIIKDFVMHTIMNYFQFDSSCCLIIADLILALSKKVTPNFMHIVKDRICDNLKQFTENGKICNKNSKKCTVIIKVFNLYDRFQTKDLVKITLRADASDAIQFFKDSNNNLQQDLIKAYIMKQISIDSKVVRKVVDQLKLNPLDYPIMAKTMIKKSLRYFLNNQPIFSLELKINGRIDVIRYLVEILIDGKKKNEAMHFINKYYLKDYYYLNKTDDRSYNKNYLLAFDAFMPTEKILSSHLPKKYTDKGYIELKSYGYEEHNVIFVNQANLTQEILDNISQSPEFGLDCEDAPVFYPYDKKIMETIQIAINYSKIVNGNQEKIKFAYIFDLPDLKNSPVFTQWFKNCVFNSYKGSIIGHTVLSDFKGAVEEILSKDEKFNCKHITFIDVKDIFKKKFQTDKCSLEYVCNKVLDQSLSKFQQCSGWQNRPLRKSQLHYAALDAVIPLILRQKLVGNDD